MFIDLTVLSLSNPDVFPFLCERGCGKRLKHAHLVQRHCNRDCAIKLKCPTCSAPFQSQMKYNQHVKNHRAAGLLDIVDPPLHDDPLPQLLDDDPATRAPLPGLGDAVLPMPGPAGDSPFETETGIITNVELPTFDMHLKLPELDLNGSLDDLLKLDEL